MTPDEIELEFAAAQQRALVAVRWLTLQLEEHSRAVERGEPVEREWPLLEKLIALERLRLELLGLAPPLSDN